MGIGYNINISADGTTEATAAVSARSIKLHHPASPSGIYWVINPSVNSGNPIQVYCDMETDGGGWMLLVQNATIGGAVKMNYTNYSLNNQTTPPNANARASVSFSYSILEWADFFKNPNKPFEYMIDAYERGQWGGIWRANNKDYRFNQTTNTATDITLLTKFSEWSYSNSGVEERMPWVNATATTAGKLTTSVSSSSSWWGTIIESASSFSPAPWINTPMPNPAVIWYWMRSL